MLVTSLNTEVWPEVPVASSDISSLVQRCSAHMPMHIAQTRQLETICNPSEWHINTTVHPDITGCPEVPNWNTNTIFRLQGVWNYLIFFSAKLGQQHVKALCEETKSQFNFVSTLPSSQWTSHQAKTHLKTSRRKQLNARHLTADGALRYSASSLTVSSPTKWSLSSSTAILNSRVFCVCLRLARSCKKEFSFSKFCVSPAYTCIILW
jgi:hypothetical protein